jgi:hypothetical protein
MTVSARKTAPHRRIHSYCEFATDRLIPMSEAHLRAILKCWATHYNSGRPHSALGPGVPDPPKDQEVIPKPATRHRLAADALVRAKSVLGGLHHEYSLAPASA